MSDGLPATWRRCSRQAISSSREAYSSTQRRRMREARGRRQAGVAGEDDGEQLAAVQIFAGEDAQLGEHGRERLLGFVEDEHGAGQGGGDVVAPAGAEGLETAPTVVDGERDAEQVAELTIKV